MPEKLHCIRYRRATDPPYNTGNDFIYQDDFMIGKEEYEEQIGLYDEDGDRLFKNTDTNGRYHSDWCSMMYPRLMVARNLLSEDGVIFVSIDDNEYENVKKIMLELYGEKNYIATVAKKTKLTSNNGQFFAPSHEYVLVFAKDIRKVEGFNDPLAQEDEEYLKLFKYEDDYSKYNIVGLYQPSLTLERSRNARYYITCPDGSKCIPPEGKRWRVVEPSYFQMLEENKVVFKQTKTSPLIDENGKQSKWNIYTKIYLKDRMKSGLRPVTFLDKFPNSEASKELIKMDIPFDFSKPRNLIQYLMKIIGLDDGIVLDFFSGSATTAHAAMQLNAEDGGSRKFIMVQLPEKCDEKSDAAKKGYPNICEVGKERIRRAGKMINNNNTLLSTHIDTGFRVFKIDDSNMNDVYYAANEYDQNMLALMESNVKSDRSDLDLLFGCLLEWGLPLSMPYSSEIIEGCTVHTYNNGDLIACFDEGIPDSVIKVMARKQPLRAVFRDSGFTGSPAKINVGEIFKMLAPDTAVKVI